MTKTQSAVLSGYIGKYYDFWGNPSDQFATWSRTERTTLESRGHYGWPNPKQGWVGGDFRQLNNQMSGGLTAIQCQGVGAYTNNHYIGNMCADLGTHYPSLSGDGAAWGPEAFDRMKPTKPVFNGLNAIYEMREVPEMLRQRFLKSGLKSISNYWLALQFGWQPLLSDCLSMLNFQRKAQKKLDFLLRHNGKPFRTRVTLAENVTVGDPVISQWDRPNPLSSFVTQFFIGTPYSTTTTTAIDKVWASARMSYWLPEGPRGIAWNTAMKMRLFGLYPSPSVFYRAVPWSWLEDWFFNTGQVLQNMEPGVANRLVYDYFYVMRSQQSVTTRLYSGTLRAFRTGAPVPYNLTASLSTDLKTRLEGDPFGWGTNQNDLTPMQLSILGALGHSHA